MPKVLTDEEIVEFRGKLCKVAAKQFAEFGYERVSMRSIADELGVSRMTPYRYFQDKAEILAAVRASGFRQLIDATELAMVSEKKTVRRLEALASVYFEFAVENRDLYTLMFDMNQDNEEHYPELAEQLARIQQLLVKVSTIGVEAGILKKDATLASQLFWAGMHGVVTLHLSSKLKLGWSFQELSKEMVETLFKGMTNG